MNYQCGALTHHTLFFSVMTRTYRALCSWIIKRFFCLGSRLANDIRLIGRRTCHLVLQKRPTRLLMCMLRPLRLCVLLVKWHRRQESNLHKAVLETAVLPIYHVYVYIILNRLVHQLIREQLF